MNNNSLKRCFAALSAAAIMATAVPFAASAENSLTFAGAGIRDGVSTAAGDANLDGYVTVSDAVAILQYIANKDKYSLKEQGRLNGDVFNRGDGLTAADALSIQKYDAGALKKLPESYSPNYIEETSTTTTTTTTT
ncbi:MAG: dockerin type I repeat-containing protein, partial [Ruminococcus sp.]|nr:dockerin type I repeat-containing protein [Ruminococcus sp.]